MNSYRRKGVRAFLGIAAMASLPAAGLVVTAQNKLPGSDLRNHRTIECQANQDVSIRGRTISSDDVAVWVEGNCDVEIADSHILSGKVAVRIQGNGDVRIANSFIQGAQGAVFADGRGELDYQNSTLRGGVSKDGMAELTDGGGNAAERIPRGATSALKASEPISCGDDDSVTVVSRYIETDGDGVVVEGDCQVLISDSHIVAGGSAVVVRGTGNVRVRNCTLEGTSAAISLEGGRAHVAGSNIEGGIDSGGGRYADGGGNAQ